MTFEKINITKTVEDVKKLLAEDKSASPTFKKMVELLLVIVTLMANKLNLNSRNSSKPPSSDPNRPRGSKKRKTKGKKRKPGGQPGHEGNHLQRVKNPDHIETLDIDKRTLPPGEYSHVGYESRQVIDIEISRKVTEYRAEILRNSQGNEFVAEFPSGVTRPAQYGKGLKSQAVYMSQQQLIPYDRIRDYFDDQCGIPISSGSLFNFNKEAYGLLDNFEEITRRHLIDSDVMNADETGINVNGKRLWLHSNSNSQWTLFFPHQKRGCEAMKAMGVFSSVQCF